MLKPFMTHDEKYIGFQFIKKSGLFQMGMCLLGEIVALDIWWNSHQAVRVVAMIGFLRVNGKSEICQMTVLILSKKNHTDLGSFI